jgi:uncharacterized membrane protein YqhA
MDKETSQVNKPQKISAIANFIFMARWLQLPLYLGLILAQIIFVVHLFDNCSNKTKKLQKLEKRSKK